ncbi:MAG: hypothetical protein Q4D26_06800 [Clostridia bacterium]|nr:hypothetical protein [Clostridia bacterium]
MAKDKNSDEIFDNVYDAIDYCLSTGYGTGYGDKYEKYKIYNFKLEKIVSSNIKRDINKLLSCIGASGIIELILSNEPVEYIYECCLNNLSFLIAHEREGVDLKYDYNADEIIKIYVKNLMGNDEQSYEVLNEFMGQKYDNIINIAVRNGEKTKKVENCFGIILLIMAVIVGFKVSVLSAIVIFFALGLPFMFFSKLPYLKGVKLFIKSYLNDFCL